MQKRGGAIAFTLSKKMPVLNLNVLLQTERQLLVSRTFTEGRAIRC